MENQNGKIKPGHWKVLGSGLLGDLGWASVGDGKSS